MMSNDMTLVQEYAQRNSEQAFSTLVSRHVNLVYSVALRQVRDPHLAEEITQSVFIILAGKAKSLSPKTILSGWLCRTARFVAANTLSIQRRRQMHEQEAQMQSTLNEPDSDAWQHIAPLLDEALNCLGEKEHDAVVLRFFDGKELKHIGVAMGTTEDAARMRVNRGLDKLREFFTKKGVTLSASAIAGAVAANSVQAAPAGLAAAITTSALSGTAITTTAVIAATKAVAMTTLQKTVITAVLAGTVGTGIYEARQAAQLREQLQTSQQEQLSLTEQIRKLEEEQGKSKQQLTELQNNPQPSARPNAAATPLRKATSIPMLPSAALEDALERAFAETTPGRREAAFDNIKKSISPADIPRALAYLASRPGTGRVESPLFSELAAQWGEADPNAAVSWANGLSDASAKRAALLGVLKGWTTVSPQSAASYAANLPAGDLQDAAVIQVVNVWSFRDARGAADWVSAFPAGKLRDKAAGPIIFWGKGQCPAAIADMLDTIGNPQLIKEQGETLASVWLSRDSAAARTWIERSPLPEDAKQRLLKRADEAK